MKKTLEYVVVVCPLSDEDGGGFVARVPDLPGCFGDGESAEAAIKDAQRAVAEWTDEYAKMGRHVPPPGTAEQMFRAQRDAEIKMIVDLKDRLKASERDFESLDSRLASLERDVQHLLDMVDNEASWERFHLITKTTPVRQKDLFC